MCDNADGELLLTLTKTRHLIITSKQFVEVSLLSVGGLSYDVYLEVRVAIIRTVLCCIVY